MKKLDQVTLDQLDRLSAAAQIAAEEGRSDSVGIDQLMSRVHGLRTSSEGLMTRLGHIRAGHHPDHGAAGQPGQPV